jgi:hypothetical protein
LLREIVLIFISFSLQMPKVKKSTKKFKQLKEKQRVTRPTVQPTTVKREKVRVKKAKTNDEFEEHGVFHVHVLKVVDDACRTEEDATSSKHKQELDKLKETDPSFYQYLQENDEDLLAFEGSDSEAPSDLSDEEVMSMDEDSDQDGDGQDDEDQEVVQPDSDSDEEEDKQNIVLTKDMVEHWQQAIKKDFSLRTLKKLLAAFRVATRDDEEADLGKGTHYVIQSDAGMPPLLLLYLVSVQQGHCRHLQDGPIRV